MANPPRDHYKPARMKDVAERAGVSLMTVSLALRGGAGADRMSFETRARVLQAVEELAYVPNARARGLRSGSSNIIGLYAGYYQVDVRSPYFTEIVSGLQDGCERFGKDLLLHGTFKDRSADEIFNALRDGRSDGLVVNMSANHPLAALLRDAEFPVVAVADAIPGVPSVVVDDVAGGKLLAEHLVEQGHKSCLYASTQSETPSAKRRRMGFLQRASEIGLAVDLQPFSWSRQWGQELMEYWQALPADTRPRAVACYNDPSAQVALTLCRENRIRVPDEMAITGFDGCPSGFDTQAILTTIRAPWAEVAKLAVESLMALLRGETLEAEQVLPVEIVKGRTT